MGYHHFGGGGRAYRVGGGGGYSGGRCKVVALAVIFFLVFVGIILAIVLPLVLLGGGRPRPCPYNTGNVTCSACTAHVHIVDCDSIGGNGTNATTAIACETVGTEEVCWEDVEWLDMTVQQQKEWRTLGQTQALWDAHQEPSYNCWDDMNSDELVAAAKLGFDQDTWDYGSGCGDYYTYLYYGYYGWYSYYYYSYWYSYYGWYSSYYYW